MSTAADCARGHSTRRNFAYNRRQMLARLILFLALVAIPQAWAQSPGQGMDYGRYHALVIGNNDYRHLPKLKTAITDAQGIADVFGSRYGFNVELLLNADRDQIVRAIAQYRSLKDSDNLIIYYAGHGVLDEASDRGFWLPVDAEKDNEARWIDVALISGNLRAMNARHVLVIADSCYSGALTRDAATALPQSTDRATWLKRMRDRRARTALVSGGLEPVMDGGGSGHSVFARSLINTLRENRDVLQGTELFNQLRGRVVVNSPQTPAYADIRMAGHEGGDFLFVPRSAAQAAAPAAGGSPDAMDLAFWDAIKGSSNPADFRAYLESFPQGRFAPLARLRAAEAAPVAAAPAPAAPPPPAPVPPIRQSTPVAAPPPVAPAPVPTPPAQVALAPSAAAGAVADAAAFQREWPAIRDRLRAQYDRSLRVYENAMAFEGFIANRFERADAETLEITVDYRAEVAAPAGRRETRTARVKIRNKAPDYEVLDWKSR